MPRLKKISLQIMSLVSGPLAERPSQLNMARQGRSTSASGLNAAVAEAIEEYVCSGNFKEDFHGLCLQHQMPFTPSVVPRPIPPSTQLVASAIIAKPDKKAVRRNPPHRPKSKLPDLKHSKMRASRSPSRPREDEQLSIRSRTQSFAVRKESEIRVDSSTALPLLMEGSTHGMSMENVVFRLETDNGVSNGHQAHGQSPPVHSVRASMPDTDKPPLTFSTKDKGDYFKPCIQVEQENMEDGRTVREIYIRGWKVDMAMMKVLERCLPVMPRLRLLHLWNVGLGVETLTLLASFLPQCIKLTTLVLDGNTLTGCPVSKLLGPTSRLQYLSLRFCGLTEIEAGGIGAQLRSTTLPLLTLLLTGNHIGDVGATYIADALLHNRTLLTLNLSANGIKDEGAASLSDALSNFQLSHQQLVERRQLLSKKWEKEKENIVPRTPLVEKNSRSRVSLAHSSSKMSASKDPRGMKDKGKVKDAKGKDKGGTTPGRKGKASKEPTLSEAKRGLQEAQKQPRSRGQSPSEHPEKGERARSRRNSLERETLERQGKFLQNKVTESQNVKGKYGRRRRRSRSDIPVINVEKQDYELSPLTKEAIYRDGHLWLPCNRTLTSLNLMRNKISERGMKSLLAAVEDQVMSDVTAKATQNREDLAPGLCRLEVLRNAVSDQCPTARELRRRMRLRDPLFRSPRMDLEKPCVTPCSIPPML